MIGKVTGIRYNDGRLSVGLTFQDATEADAQMLLDYYNNKSDVSCEIKKKGTRRTLDANAYFHSLCRQLAKKLTIPFGMCKNMLISRYGEPVLTEDGHVAQIISDLPQKDLVSSESIHVWAVGTSAERTIYNVYRDTHTYTSLEFAKLLEGCIAECIEQGIPTDTEQYKQIIEKGTKK